jgi:DNA-binding CsgD family transcriptional regulator
MGSGIPAVVSWEGTSQMHADTISPTATLTALALAQNGHCGGLSLPSAGLEALLADRGGATLPQTRRTAGGATSFLLDRELLVREGDGDSILRLPWFHEDLFVGRPFPDIREIPGRVRGLATSHYRAALAGERGSYTFMSYGHAFTVDAIPVRDADGDVDGLLAIALPARRSARSGTATELTPREIEMLQLAARGMSAPGIAEHLVLSRHTVRTHFQNIYGKWDVPDRAAAVAEGFRQGLID